MLDWKVYDFVLFLRVWDQISLKYLLRSGNALERLQWGSITCLLIHFEQLSYLKCLKLHFVKKVKISEDFW